MEKEPSNSSKWIWIAIVILVLIGVGIFCSYLLGQKQTVSVPVVQPVPPIITTAPTLTPTISASPTASTSPVSTVDWKTYTNSQYGFSVKYPKTWTINNNSTDGGSQKSLINIGGPVAESNDSLLFTYYDSMTSFNSAWFGKGNAKTVSEFISNNGIKKVGDISISGVSSTEFMSGGIMSTVLVILVPYNNHIYLVQSKLSQLSATDQQILSTFQFAK